MIRRMAQTVRCPVARMAPTARVWALGQTQWENSGAKAARMATISGGRSTGVVSRTEGSCTTVDHGQHPLDLPVNLGWRRARQLSDLAKAESVGLLRFAGQNRSLTHHSVRFPSFQ